MKILVDADACPKVIKEILFRAAKRLKVPLILYANHPMVVPQVPWIKFVQVQQGFDVADSVIESQVEANDLVITADIPLADSVIDKHAIAINPRGMIYTKDNIKEKLAMRNLMSELRDAGELRGGPSAMGKRDQQNFANALDRLLAKRS